MSLREALHASRFWQKRLRRQRLENTFHAVRERPDLLRALEEEVGRLLAAAYELDCAGAPRSRSAELFEEVAALQDQAASRMGLDTLGFRVIGSPNWGDNLGHLAMLDVFVKLQKLGHLSPELRVLGLQHPANEHYVGYWEQHLPRLTMSAAELAAFNTAVGPLQECTSFFRTTSGIQDLYRAYLETNRAWEGKPPLLELTTEDHEWGRSQLRALGVDPDRWFVGLHVRSGDPRRAKAGRNADVMTYLPAIKRIVASGGTVIRMGNPLMPRLPILKGLVDYAHSPLRSQRLDVYLFASSSFFIGTASGPIDVPPTFGVPILATNWSTLGLFPFSSKARVVPKVHVEPMSGRELRLDETMMSPVAWSEDPSISPHLIERDNSASEIAAAVDEMLEFTVSRSERDWSPTSDQKRAQGVVSAYSELSGATIAQSFLSLHPGWV